MSFRDLDPKGFPIIGYHHIERPVPLRIDISQRIGGERRVHTLLGRRRILGDVVLRGLSNPPATLELAAAFSLRLVTAAEETIAGEVADRPNAVITEQVANGVSVRMAVLFLLLGAGLEPVDESAVGGGLAVA